MKANRKVAIVLFIIQALALFGGLVNGDLLNQNLFKWIGFLLPGLIGVALWFFKKK